MAQSSIFGPFLAMVVLTFVVWVYMYVRRITFIRSLGLDTQGLNLEQEFEEFGDQPIENTEQLYASIKGWLTGSNPRARDRVEQYLADNSDLTQQEIDQRLDEWEQQARQTAREAITRS